MNKKFLLAGIVTTIVLFVLNAIVFVAFLDNFFHSHPAVSKEFMNKLYRPQNELIVWATVLCSVAVGFLVTTVVSWSGAKTFTAGLRSGLIFGILFLCSVDMGLYASTNNFTLAGALADMTCSTITITLSAGTAGWLLGRG
jgi:hypothetical protein